MTWQVEYCNSHKAGFVPSDSLPVSSQDFLNKLGLFDTHPFCRDQHFFSQLDHGPLVGSVPHDSWWECLVTFFLFHAPSFLATTNLWIRLCAGYLAPMGVVMLFGKQVLLDPNNQRQSNRRGSLWLAAATLLSCCIVLMDSMYSMEYHSSRYGVKLCVATVILVAWPYLRNMVTTRKFFSWRDFNEKQGRPWFILVALFCVAGSLTLQQILPRYNWDNLFVFDQDTVVNIEAGLYFSSQSLDSSNTNVSSLSMNERIVQNWPLEKREYSNPTPWILNGDSRTGLPFLLYTVPELDWTRFFLPVSDGEVVALDFAFPPQGHDPEHPVYLILHGANGGSNEEYVKDFAWRETKTRSSTVVVMVSRGNMDLPLQSLNFYQAGRWEDVHRAAQVLQKAISPNQVLAGVGYSMGAIVLANYAAAAGQSCALDVGFCISGALDCRYQQNFTRSQRLWQPMISHHVKLSQHLAKWGERLRNRWKSEDMIQLLRAHDMVALDNYTSVIQYQSPSLTSFYEHMCALGDIPLDTLVQDYPTSTPPIPNHAKIHNLAIPLGVLHAMDDPISTWRNVVGNPGSLLNPQNLVDSGDGNLFLLLTRKGGHVGWPQGWFPWQHNWSFMNNAASSFTHAVMRAKNKVHVND